MSIYYLPPPSQQKRPGGPPPAAPQVFQKALPTTNAQVAARLAVAVSASRGAVDAQVAALVRQASYFRTLSASDGQVAALSRVVSYFRSLGATDGNVAARGAMLVSVRRGATDGQTAARGALGLSIARSATNAQAASRTLLVFIARFTTDSQAAALISGRLYQRALAAVDAEVASLRRAINALRSGVNTQAALLIRTSAPIRELSVARLPSGRC